MKIESIKSQVVGFLSGDSDRFESKIQLLVDELDVWETSLEDLLKEDCLSKSSQNALAKSLSALDGVRWILDRDRSTISNMVVFGTTLSKVEKVLRGYGIEPLGYATFHTKLNTILRTLHSRGDSAGIENLISEWDITYKKWSDKGRDSWAMVGELEKPLKDFYKSLCHFERVLRLTRFDTGSDSVGEFGEIKNKKSLPNDFDYMK